MEKPKGSLILPPGAKPADVKFCHRQYIPISFVTQDSLGKINPQASAASVACHKGDCIMWDAEAKTCSDVLAARAAMRVALATEDLCKKMETHTNLHRITEGQ